MKKAISFFASAAIDELPLTYWHILFPQPYWGTIQAEAAKNGLDPYMVASLIRQESEFNPGVVSHANAWGLIATTSLRRQANGQPAGHPSLQ